MKARPIVKRGFGSDVSPLPLRMKICLPSCEKIAPVGYQPVGMKPSGALEPGLDTSTTATTLLSAFATSNCLSSGDRLTEFGVEPGGASGNIDTPIRSTTRRVSTSITETVLVFAQATKRRASSFVSTIAFGCSPVAISPAASSVHASNINTFAPPQSDTNNVSPSCETVTLYGSAANSTVRITRPLARSIRLSVCPTTSTAYNRSPSGEAATPPTKLCACGLSLLSHCDAGSNGRPTTRSTDLLRMPLRQRSSWIVPLPPPDT